MKIIIISLLVFLNIQVLHGQDKTKTIVEVYVNNSPFSFLNEDDEIEGFCIDIITTILDDQGRNYTYKLTNLRRDSMYLDSENIDIKSFATKAKNQDGWFLSNCYLATSYHLIHRKENLYNHLKDLHDKKIVVITGRYSSTHLLQRGARYVPNITFRTDVTEGLKLVSSGQVDVAILLKGNYENIVIDKQFEDLVINKALLPTQEYCFASKDSILIKDLNKSLAILIDDDTLSKIYQKWFAAASDEKGENILRIIIIIIVIIFGTFAFMQRRKLKNNVKETDLAKTAMLKYAKAINNFSNSYVKIFLTNVKKEEISILKKDKYELIENGLAMLLESLHPDDREFYIGKQQKFVNGKLDSVTLHVRMFDLETEKYNLHELILNVVEKDKFGKIYKFATIARNESLQEEMLFNQSKDIHDLNLAIKSAKLIRWDIDIIKSKNRIINIDNKEYIHTNKDLFRKIDPKDYKQLRNLINQIRRGENIDSITIDIDIFDTGAYKSYEVMATVERGDDGSPFAIYGILRDVSKALRYQELLQKELLQNKIISKHISVGVGFFDKNGVCRDMNVKGLELLGVEKSFMLGNANLFEFKHISKESKDELRNGGSISYQITYDEIINKNRNNKHFFPEARTKSQAELFSITCSSVFNDDKELIGYANVYTDITEITRSRENIMELKTRVKLALDAGAVSAWTYKSSDESYTSLNTNHNTVPNMSSSHQELLKILHPDDIEILDNAYNAIQTRESDKEVFVIRTIINNELVIYRLSIIPRELDGDVKHIIGVTKDITEQVNAELELKNVNNLLEEKNIELNFNLKLLKEIIERMPGVLFIKEINSDLKYYLVNTSFCQKIARKPQDKVIGHCDYEIFPKEIADEFRKSDFDCIKMNSTVQKDEDVIVDGKKYKWRTIKTPISLTNDMKLLICMSMDVTEIYRMKEKAEQSDVLKSQFLANMSHEIRTPLNAIVGFSNLLVETDDEETKQEFNEIIMTNTDLLLNLINDILDLSKMESGVVNFNDEFFNVNELLEEMYLSFSLRAVNVTIKYEKLKEPINAKIDINRIKQVLNNYLSNALKYTTSGDIVFGCEVERGGLKLFVKDTGIGIAEENKSKVFDRFEKLDSFAQGSGLGLSICKTFADLKQGEVGFDSVLGEGSYFWIWIPCEMKVEE